MATDLETDGTEKPDHRMLSHVRRKLQRQTELSGPRGRSIQLIEDDVSVLAALGAKMD